MIRAVGTRKLPSSTVAFVFTDVDGWTRLLPGMASTRGVRASVAGVITRRLSK